MIELQLQWQKTGDGARILQGYGDLSQIHIPESIEGLPIKEVGPYCFSASQPKPVPDTRCRSFLFDHTYKVIQEASIESPSLPALAGRYLEEVNLPPCLEVLHNGAFYNCRQLKSLGLGQGLRAIGSDVFTNCQKLSRILYQGGEDKAEALNLLLGRLEMDISLFLVSGSPSQESLDTSLVQDTQNRQGTRISLDSQGTQISPDTRSTQISLDSQGTRISPDTLNINGGLFFPEFYEWMDEVTPAHLFSRSINGEGFRMRKCFQNGQLSYEKYDACFPNAMKTESPQSLCRIALTRLLYPRSLKDSWRRLYREAIDHYPDVALDLLVSRRDPDLLELLSDILPHSHILDRCIRADWAKGAALIMEKETAHKDFAHKSYDFDDFS